MKYEREFANGHKVKQAEPRLEDVLRSDKLPGLLSVVHSLSAAAILARDLVKFRVVLDASAVQEHLRWVLGKRTNPAATTSLHEAIVSGVVIAFAPSYIESEIIEHEEELAKDTRTTTAEVRKVWLEMRKDLHLYPINEVPDDVRQVIDRDDEPYRIVRRQIGARAIMTRDHHFGQMGEPVVMEQIDMELRNYARASTVQIGVALGSGVVFRISMDGILKLLQLLRSVARWLKNQSPAVQLGIVGGMLLLALHPKSRSTFVKACQFIAPVVKDVAVQGIAAIAIQGMQATREASAHLKMIEATFPPARRRTLIMHARTVGLMAKTPLSLVEFEQRIREDGYQPRSPKSRVYLRRTLMKSPDFRQLTAESWVFRPATGAADHGNPALQLSS